MTRMGKATEKGLDEVSKAVLGPVFHGEGVSAQKVFVCFQYRYPGGVMQQCKTPG